jgi:predicted transposase YdaD
MPYDNLCKLLAETYPARFAAWLLEETPASIEVLKTELSIEPIRADSVTFLGTIDRVLHLEFQTEIASDPPLPLRMLDYWVRLHRRYRLPVTQVLILLKPPAIATTIEREFRLETTIHRYRVVCMWEEEPETFLADETLLPLATLAKSDRPERLLNRVAQQLGRIESRPLRQEISTRAQLLAGLKFDKRLIQTIFRGESMRESVIYQDILQQGELKLLSRQLTRRLGEIPAEVQMQIQALSVEKVEALGEALFDFSELADLVTWLENDREI